MFPDFLIYFWEVSLPAQCCKLQEDRDLYVVSTGFLVPNACLLNDMSGSPIVYRQRRKKLGHEKDGEEERTGRDKGERRREEGREWKERRVDGRRGERKARGEDVRGKIASKQCPMSRKAEEL